MHSQQKHTGFFNLNLQNIRKMFHKLKILLIKLIRLISQYLLLPQIHINLRIHPYIPIFPKIVHFTIHTTSNNIHNKILNLICTNLYIFPIARMQNLYSPTFFLIIDQSQLNTISTIIRFSLYLNRISIGINYKDIYSIH